MFVLVHLLPDEKIDWIRGILDFIVVERRKTRYCFYYSMNKLRLSIDNSKVSSNITRTTVENVCEQIYNIIHRGIITPLERALQTIVAKIMCNMTAFTIAFFRTKY
jgi:hypothetical protein